jgi:Pup amidohydrolase
MRTTRARLPKLCGTDIEVGNFILGTDSASRTGGDAARALLREIDGLPAREAGGSWLAAPPPSTCGSLAASSWHPDHSASWAPPPRAYDRQDWGRKFLRNGSCAYIDLDHLELASAETLSARDQLACQRALLRIARSAMIAANARLPRGRRLQVLLNNTDGSGSSYGSHVNVLLDRQAWDDLFDRRLHHLLYLAAFQVSSIVFTGQGKVGSENQAPPVDYQLSQRADYFETLVGEQTTYRRPLVNARCEPLAGGAGRRGRADRARIHSIFFDHSLCPVASWLRLGSFQIVLAMLEAGRVDGRCLLDDPLEAVLAWSHDPTLRARAHLVDRRALTAAELQAGFVEAARSFVDEGGCAGIVPDAESIVGTWERVVDRLLARDLDALAPQLDWVLKLSILERAMNTRGGLDWSSPQIKHLDHLYSSLDPDEGLYWSYERAGLVTPLVGDERITWFESNPPECTRAWTRGMLLSRAGVSGVEDVNWDWVRVSAPGRGGWRIPRTVHLDDPLGWTREHAASAFEGGDGLHGLVDRLEALDEASAVIR